MGGYYEERLSGTRLLRCYDLAPARIRRYLDAEIDFVLANVRGAGRVLELGCGYGRVLKRVAPFVSAIVGNDTSRTSLGLARSYMATCPNCDVTRMDASRMAFRSQTFDAVICIQNGISAFNVDRRRLTSEAIRVTKTGGLLLFSSYSPQVWEARLDWFRIQAQHGLLGEIDEDNTGEGTIVCKDGFRATTVGGEEFVRLFSEQGLAPSIREVDGSSLFAIVVKCSGRARPA